MTEREAFAQLYFGVRLFVADTLVVGCDVGDPGHLNYYYDDGVTVAPTNVNVNSPFTFTRQVGGRTVTIVLDGSMQGQVVLNRACTVTASERYRVWFSSSLCQLMTKSGSSFNLIDAPDAASHLVPAQPAGGSLTYDVSQDLTTLWNSVTNPDKYSFGGKVDVHVEFFTNLILRDPDQVNAIMRANAAHSNIILRDA